MDAEGISMEEFKDAFSKGNMFASGIGRSARSVLPDCTDTEKLSTTERALL